MSATEMRRLNSKRIAIAEEVIRCIDTVTLTTCIEVEDIYRRAFSGEFDHIFLSAADMKEKS